MLALSEYSKVHSLLPKSVYANASFMQKNTETKKSLIRLNTFTFLNMSELEF